MESRGALLDVGIYPLHFAMMVFGHDIEEIVSTCTYFETGVDASDSITIHYKDGNYNFMRFHGLYQ